MRPRGRRRLDRTLIVVAAGAAAGLSSLGGVIAESEERIDRLWAVAELQAEGPATVTEAIDYNFGLVDDGTSHGLERIIPGLEPGDPISVDSPTAPDGIADAFTSLDGGQSAMTIRIGDPNKTVNGHHRYYLRYQLLTIGGHDLAWDGVGLSWRIPIEEAELHVVAPWRFEDVDCDRGPAGSQGGCRAEQPEDGHLVVETDGLDAGEGVTLYARAGADLAAAPTPPAPGPSPWDEGSGIAMPAAAASVGALGAGASVSTYVRRRGRERVGAGGAADAAYATGSTSEVRMDEAELAKLATTDVAPPDDLTAPQGGVILAEDVDANHKVAWLIEAAIAGAIDLEEEGGKTVRIVRTGDGDEETRKTLNVMFAGRDSIELGKYDPVFAKGWIRIGSTLETWSKSSDLWDKAADKRKTRTRVLGFLAAAIGDLGIVGGGYLAATNGDAAIPVLLAAALLAGGGFAAALRGWELRVRTPQGSAQYLRVESFRRFLHDSEAYHAEEAAKRGVLREYTAWAVAVGELDHWSTVVRRATNIPSDTAGLHYVYIASALHSSSVSASTAPSSSGSGGGGGGGGSGGGGGGGGGGSW